MALRKETNQSYKRIPLYKPYESYTRSITIKVSIPYKEAGKIDHAISKSIQHYNQSCTNQYYIHRVGSILKTINTFVGRDGIYNGAFHYDVIVSAEVGVIETNHILYNCRLVRSEQIGLELQYDYNGVKVADVLIYQDKIPNNYQPTQRINVVVKSAKITPGGKYYVIGKILFYPRYNYTIRMQVAKLRPQILTKKYTLSPGEKEFDGFDHPLADLNAADPDFYYNLVMPGDPVRLRDELVHRVLLPNDETPVVVEPTSKDWKLNKIEKADILLYTEDNQLGELIAVNLCSNIRHAAIIRINEIENKYVCGLISILQRMFEVVSLYKPLNENPLNAVVYLYGTQPYIRTPLPQSTLQETIRELTKQFQGQWTIKDEEIEQESFDFYQRFKDDIYTNMFNTYSSLAKKLYEAYGDEIQTKYKHIVDLYRSQRIVPDYPTPEYI